MVMHNKNYCTAQESKDSGSVLARGEQSPCADKENSACKSEKPLLLLYKKQNTHHKNISYL